MYIMLSCTCICTCVCVFVGGVGFDINCGVRLIRTNLMEKDVSPVKEQLAQVPFTSTLLPLFLQTSLSLFSPPGIV